MWQANFWRVVMVLGSFLLVPAYGVEAVSKVAPRVGPKPAASQKLLDQVNINTADVATLCKVKWFGKKKAEAIVAYRTKYGEFKSVDELLKVEYRGITQKWLDRIKEFLTV